MTYRYNWGEDRVYFQNGEGELESLAAAWTDVLPCDPFVTVSAGRSVFCVRELLELSEQLERLQEEHEEGTDHAGV